MPLLEDVLKEINSALSSYETMNKQSKYNDMSDLTEDNLAEIVTTLHATIQRWAPAGTSYAEQANAIFHDHVPSRYYSAHRPLAGVLRSLRQAYEQGYLSTVQQLVHADLFADFLEMAEYLLLARFKDAAAVLIGGVLEEHLRKLCLKHGLAVYAPDGPPRKASQLNDDLAKVAYDKLEQKAVTYWLDIRNKAAHGEYTKLDNASVRQMLTGVRDFVTKHGA